MTAVVLLVTAEVVCALMLLILAVDTHKVTYGLCQPRHTEDSKEEYAPDLTILKPLRAGNCNVDWSRTYYTEGDGSIFVDCGRCSIYNLQVSAKRNTQHDRLVCSGLTPELFTSRLDCMWKKTCILRYSTATIILSLPNQQPGAPNCVGEEPGTVEVGYSCLDSDIQVDAVIKGFQAIDSQLGLIRSHNYAWGNRVAYPKYKDRFVLDISPSAEIIISGKNYFMLFYVVTYNVSVGDKLIVYNSNVADSSLETDECEVSSTWQVDALHNITSSIVRFEFLLNATSHPSPGFDICFQWFDVENVSTLEVFSRTVEHCKRAMKKQGNAFATFDMIKDTSTQAFRGFIKSHWKFPWNYPRVNANFPFIKNWSSEVHVLQAPNNLKHLKVQVVQLKLAAGDRLQLINGHQKVSVPELLNTRKFDFLGKSVTINFSVRHSSDQTDAGFLICYQWYTPKQDNLADDLCSNFTYDVHPCGKGNKKLLKDKCGLWKKPKKNGNKQQKRKKQHRKGRKLYVYDT